MCNHLVTGVISVVLWKYRVTRKLFVVVFCNYHVTRILSVVLCIYDVSRLLSVV